MIKTPITDNGLLEHIDSLANDGREIFLLGGGKIRLIAVNATRMVNEMRANHKLGPLETYILGQGYIAGSLLSSTVKGNDRVLMEIECGGPIKGMSIEAWACGAVRGYLKENPIKLERPLTSLNTSLLYGPGFLTISKILEGSKTPFSGQIMLEHGLLADDLALYFRQSEQTPTLFYFSLDFDDEARVMGAGGLFIQVLPGAEDDLIAKLDERSKELKSMAKAISSGESVIDYVYSSFSDFNIEHLEHSPIGFSCPCSRKNFEYYLSSLPESEKEGILKGEFPLEVECFNCSSIYSFSKEEIEKIFNGGSL